MISRGFSCVVARVGCGGWEEGREEGRYQQNARRVPLLDEKVQAVGNELKIWRAEVVHTNHSSVT